MDELPWYRRFFDEVYLRVYTPILTPERTAADVEGIVRLLGLPAGSRLLDLACGHGRHAIPLAERGYRVTGLDLSAVALERAAAEAARRGVEVRWVHSDMRAIPFVDEFDAVINIFTAFGYLESEEEDGKVLRAVQGALTPGGLFLQEMIHRENLTRRFAPQSFTRYDDGLVVLEEREFDLRAGRIRVRLTLLHPDGRREEYHHDERIYALTELTRLLTAAGLQVEACYGGLDGSPLTLESRRLAVLSRKGALASSA